MKCSDNTPMPFGKHKGVTLEHVPADYLLWLGDELDPTTASKKALMVYIAENRKVLEQEVEDQRREGGGS